jgi:ribosome recycling factor
MFLHSEKDLKTKLDAAVDSFSERIKQLRAGRVRADMFENIPVEAYGMVNQLKGLANINVESALSVAIQPYDPGNTSAIHKAIQDANLGFSPILDGAKVRINVPPLTEETRKKTVKELEAIAEEAKVGVRQIRQKFMDDVKELEGVSEDEQARSKVEIQKQIDATIARVEQVAKAKESEIMSL